MQTLLSELDLSVADLWPTAKLLPPDRCTLQPDESAENQSHPVSQPLGNKSRIVRSTVDWHTIDDHLLMDLSPRITGTAFEISSISCGHEANKATNGCLVEARSYPP